MAAPLAFNLQLTGNFAAALAPVNAKLGEADKLLGKVKQSSDVKGGQFLSGIKDGLDKIKGIDLGSALAGGAFTLGISEGVGMLVNGAKSFVGLLTSGVGAALNIGKSIIDASGKAESLRVSFDLLLGKEQASKVLGDIGGITKNTPFDDDAIAAAIRPLLLGGMKPGQMLNDIIASGIDTSVALGNGIAGVGEVFSVFEKVQSTGKVDPKALKALLIDQGSYFKNLGDLYGVSAEVARKQVEQGKIAKASLISVVLDEMQKRQGGALGIGAIAGSQTVETRLQKLQDLPSQYFKKIAESKGYGAFSGFLGKLLEQLDPDGPAGVKIMAAIEGITNKILGALEGVDIGDLVTKLADGATSIGSAFEKAWPFIKSFGESIASVALTLQKAWGHAERMAAAIGSVQRALGMGSADEKVSDRLQAIARGPKDRSALEALGVIINDADTSATGRRIALGLAQGIRDGMPTVKAASGDLAATVPDTLQTAMEIQSPSRVMMRLGGYSAEGFALGLEGGEGGVQSSARRALADAATGGAEGAGAARGGGPVTISFGDIVIQSGASSPAAVAADVGQAVRVELGKVVAEMRLGIGA